MDLYWGIKENNKRKFDEIDSDGDSYRETMEPDRKKFKLFKNDKMIYTIDSEIHFNEPINARSIETLIKKITKLINKNNDKYKGSKERFEISIIMSSPGGSIDSLLKFVDFISLTKKKYPFVTFTSIATANIASAATVACTIMDKRLMTRHGTAMIHQLRSSNAGKFSELMSYSKHLTDLHEKLINIYLQHCNCTREKLEELLKHETWMDAETYKSYGFIDEIIG